MTNICTVVIDHAPRCYFITLSSPSPNFREAVSNTDQNSWFNDHFDINAEMIGT